MKRNFAFILAALIFVSAALAQKPAPAKAGNDAEDYKALTAKLKGGDTKIDFTALRLAFTKTKSYSAYGGDRDLQRAASDALTKGDYKEAVKKAGVLLDDDYTDMDAHVISSVAYRGLENGKMADFHKSVYLGLVNSILSSGDGKTAATAFVVISTSEEYIVLRALGLAPGSQSLVHQDRHSFDVLMATDPKTKETIKIYFNIDIVWKKESEMFSK